MLKIYESRTNTAKNMLQTAWTARPHDITNHALQWGGAVGSLFKYSNFINPSLGDRKIGTRFPEYLAEVQKETRGIWGKDNGEYNNSFEKLKSHQQYNIGLILFSALVGENRCSEVEPKSTIIRGTDTTDPKEAAWEYVEGALSYYNLGNIHGTRLANAVDIAFKLIDDYEAAEFSLTNNVHFMNATMAFHDEMNRTNGWGANDHYVRHYGAHIFSDPYDSLPRAIKERNVIFMLAVYAAWQAGKNPNRMPKAADAVSLFDD